MTVPVCTCDPRSDPPVPRGDETPPVPPLSKGGQEGVVSPGNRRDENPVPRNPVEGTARGDDLLPARDDGQEMSPEPAERTPGGYDLLPAPELVEPATFAPPRQSRPTQS